VFQLAIEIAGVKQVNRALAVSAAAIKDLRPVWEDLYDDFLKRERVLFVRQGNSGSPTREMETAGPWGAWAPLNPAYAARKRAQGFGSKILVRTGRLMDSLTQRNHPDAVFMPMPTSMSFGTRVPYSGRHQTGTTSMKRREPIRITEAQARFWVRLVHKFLIESGQFERENF